MSKNSLLCQLFRSSLSLACLWVMSTIPAIGATKLYCPGIHYDSRYYHKKLLDPAWVKKHPLNRVMFIGNSLTRHPPLESSGWGNFWGMAASAPDKDWAHLVQLYLSIDQNMPVEISIANTDLPWIDRDFEDVKAELERFRPEAVFIQIGDNAMDGSIDGFKQPYMKLLDLVGKYTARTYMLNTWRLSNQNGVITIYIKDMAGDYRSQFIDIHDIYKDTRNQAISESLCLNNSTINPNVCWHPGDVGMRAIAAKVCEKRR